MLQEFLSRASFWSPEYICQSAWIEHAPFAFWICDVLRPRRFVELGTHYGYSYFAFCQAIERLALGTAACAVDTWKGDEHAGFYDENVFQAVSEQNTKKYAAFSRLIRSTFDDALQNFEDRSIDLLHIDGRHFYGDVKHDFESWRPKLTDNAVVLFHDTNVWERGFGVWQLFEELSGSHPGFQFFHCHGLGVLAIGEAPPALAPLFEGSEEAGQIRAAYAALGGALSVRVVQERLAELSAQLAEKDARLAELSARLAEKDARLAEKDARLAELSAQLIDQRAQAAEYLYHLDRINAWGWFRLGVFLDRLIRAPFRVVAKQRSNGIADVCRDPTASKHTDQTSIAAAQGAGPSNGVDELGPESARSIDIDHSLAVPFSYMVQPRGAFGRAAAILHIFYEDLAVELRSYLRDIPGEVDLFIATADAGRKLGIEKAFASWARGSVEVRLMANRGRDIAPKLIGFRDVYDCYDLVLHLHTKRSHHGGSALAHWRHYLLEALMGGPLIINSIFEAFERNPRLGIVAAQHFEPIRHWIHWGSNFDHARRLAARMGFSIDPGTVLDFPSGSMFWARSAALRPLIDLALASEEFEPEDGQRDGTLAHAIERLYFHVCERAGFDWIKIARPELMADTPAIVQMRDENELDRFFHRYVFRLHDPKGVLPRTAPPAPLGSPAPALVDAIRDHVLGARRPIAPHTRVAIGLVTSDSEAFSLRYATNAALLSLKHAGLPVQRTLWLLDNRESSASVAPQDVCIVRLPSGGDLGVGAGHNRLMQAAFAEGATIYIAISPEGVLSPDAVGALVRMVQAQDGRALVEALQLPTGDPKAYDPVTLDTPCVSGTCLAVPRAAFEELDGFGDDFFTHGDEGLSQRAKASGFALKTCPAALFLRAVTNRKINAGEIARHDR